MGYDVGETILLGPGSDDETLRHEYVHVLQYRAIGWSFVPQYLRGGLANWYGPNRNPLEAGPMDMDQLYRNNSWLDTSLAPWDLAGR